MVLDDSFDPTFKVLNVHQMATFLNMSEDSIRSRCKSQEIPAVKESNGRWYCESEKFETYIIEYFGKNKLKEFYEHVELMKFVYQKGLENQKKQNQTDNQ